MKHQNPYRGYRFAPQIISHGVWSYHRFSLSLRDVEELLAERGISVSYETIRQWCAHFGPQYARKLRRHGGGFGDVWHLDEVFVSIRGERHYLWRAIDRDGHVLDILVQRRRNARAAKRFFRKMMKNQQRSPNRLVTDRLGNYRVPHREEMPTVPHDTETYANNRIEASHRRARGRERQMKGFRSAGRMQRFLSVHDTVANLLNWSRHLMSAANYRMFRRKAFESWAAVVYV